MVSSRNTRHLWSLEHRLRKRLWIFAHRSSSSRCSWWHGSLLFIDKRYCKMSYWANELLFSNFGLKPLLYTTTMYYIQLVLCWDGAYNLLFAAWAAMVLLLLPAAAALALLETTLRSRGLVRPNNNRMHTRIKWVQLVLNYNLFKIHWFSKLSLYSDFVFPLFFSISWICRTYRSITCFSKFWWFCKI